MGLRQDIRVRRVSFHNTVQNGGNALLPAALLHYLLFIG